jgi:hypothetical protein
MEGAVTEHVAGFVKRSPRVGAHDAIGIQPSRALELAHGIDRRLSIAARGVVVRGESERAKSHLDVGHCVAGVT